MHSVRFLQLADHSGGSIVEGGRVIVRQYAAYRDCDLVMRVAGSLVGGARGQRVEVGKNWVVGISVRINGGAGDIMMVKKLVVL